MSMRSMKLAMISSVSIVCGPGMTACLARIVSRDHCAELVMPSGLAPMTW